jgi:hypothetical protein
MVLVNVMYVRVLSLGCVSKQTHTDALLSELSILTFMNIRRPTPKRSLGDEEPTGAAHIVGRRLKFTDFFN